MAQICEFCKEKSSRDVIQGVSLCDECVQLFTALRTNNQEAPQKVYARLCSNQPTQRAKELFQNRLSKFKPDTAGLVAEQRKQQVEKEEQELRVRKEAAVATEIAQIRSKRESETSYDAFLLENGHTGYYEYKAINLIDETSGSVNIDWLNERLNALGRQGWHLRCAYANEIGRNESSAGMGGFSTGTNATIDQSVLIFERFIRFKTAKSEDFE